jgi:uroporphyrinogen decarboxylase
MPQATMTSRQRVNAMFERKDHDRVPRNESFWADTIRRWQQEGLGGADEDGGGGIRHNNGSRIVLEMLGNDFAGLGGWSAIFPGHHEVIAEDEETVTYVNDWLETVKYWKHRSGTPEHIGWGCTDRTAWEQTFKPALEKLEPQLDPESMRQACGRATEAGRWRHLNTLESFEALRHMAGDVGTMMAMAEDPEWVAEMSRVWTDAMLRRLDAQVEALGGNDQVDGVWCYGDMAFNHATMCSPQMYRELIWPDHKRMADWAHAHDAWFIFHTDGNVNGVMDLYLQAGFDCLQPLEAKAGMDVRRLCPQYGDRLAFFGNIDVMIMGSNDLEKIEEEIRTKFAAGMATRGYAYHSDHSVPPTVSWPTYQRIIELVDRYGWYT